MQFDQMLSFQNTITILPEIMLIVTLLVLIILDLLIKNSSWLSSIALIGLSSSFVILLIQWNHPSSISFFGNIHTDLFGNIFRSVLVFSTILCILLSLEYIERSGMEIATFLTLILGATIGGMFLCIANNLITIFVALECLSLCSYILAGYAKKDVRSNEAALKYLLIGGASSSILVYGFSWLYGLSGGQLQYETLANGVQNHVAHPLPIWVAFSCIVVGVGFKISAVPFHQWTPDVYEGSPTPVVAFLSVGSKTAALAFTIRLFTIVFLPIEQEWHLIVEIIGLLSMVFGNLIAVTQTSLKRMLAYSSISQAGYLIIGIIAGNPYGYTSMITYLIIYSFMNLGAFACVIMFGLRTGTDQIRDYTGLYFKDPWLVFGLSVCFLSLAGIPPFAGFFGKLYLFWSGWNSGLYLLVYTALITSVVSIYYYLRVIKNMLTKEAKEMSAYVRNYSIASIVPIPTNGIEIGISVCVLASTIVGFIIDHIVTNINSTLFTNYLVVG
jgi:NAD(P)H-quinone oxidoreductase subunit 2